MCTSPILNSVGLSLDIAGALILWFCPFPLLWKDKGGNYGMITPDGESIKKHLTLSRLGLGFIAAGFFFQLLSNFF